MGSRNTVFLQIGQLGHSGKSLRWSREGLAHLKMNTRAYLHGKIFLLKYSLSNKNVAERRRGWPA